VTLEGELDFATGVAIVFDEANGTYSYSALALGLPVAAP
jgi:hypothetical protein